jgi:membrane-associated protease RseP (regulator of RpoE activity)
MTGGRRLLFWAGLLAGAISLRAAVPAAQEPPVVLPEVSVMEGSMNIKVSTSYYRMGKGSAFATSMIVRTVKPGSFAEQAGLKTGMEIVSIQGTKVAGLNQGDVERLLSQPGKEVVVLQIRRPWKIRTEEMRIWLRAPELSGAGAVAK